MSSVTKYYANDDIEITKSDDWNPGYIWQDADGNPINITGFNFKLSVKRFYEDTTIVIGPINGTIDDATGGLFSFLIASTLTQNLSGEYVYDIQVIDAANIKTTRIKGKLIVSGEATNG